MQAAVRLAPRDRRHRRHQLGLRAPAIHWEPVYSASKHAVQAFVHGVRRQLVGTGSGSARSAPGVVAERPMEGYRRDDTRRRGRRRQRHPLQRTSPTPSMFMLTRPRHVAIRDLVILPVNQEI